MPEQIRQISGTAGLFSSEIVAQKCVQGIADGEYTISVGMYFYLLL